MVKEFINYLESIGTQDDALICLSTETGIATVSQLVRFGELKKSCSN